MSVFNYDVVVIGGGLLGCFAARNLTRYGLKVALLEKREDLCTGISRANTAIVYSGCDTKPGTRKTAMCVKASQGFAGLCRELGVRYSQCGSIMVCFGQRGADVLRKKLRDGKKNGVSGLKLLSRKEVLELEPNIAANVHSGLFVPDTGTVMPWELCLAAAGYAADNGAEFHLNTEVSWITQNKDAENGYLFDLHTSKGTFSAKVIVNCAGMAADRLLEMVSEPVVRIVPTAGDYLVLDTKVAGQIKHVIFHEPESKGKGLTLVPTVDGNILIGPTDRDIRFAAGRDITGFEDGYETAHEGLDLLRELVAEIIPSLSLDHVIRSFGAIRPNPYLLEKNANGKWAISDKSVSDFCIVESENGAIISLIGVKTPGLTCADELGAFVAEKVARRLGKDEGDGIASCARYDEGDGQRAVNVRLSELSFKERKENVCKNHDYGAIVCRCRGVSEGEIKDAIRSFPGAVTRDGIKRRTGAGSGRCQGGFCGQTVQEMLSDAKINKPDLQSASTDFIELSAQPYDVVVIGGGPAGMAAALGASFSASQRVLLIERADTLGGILNQCLHSGFGLTYFGEELTGQEYARRFKERVAASGVEVLTGTIVLSIGDGGQITLSGKKTGLARIQAMAVVLATGCRERPIGSLPVAGTRPAGIYSAGAAQKMINLGGYDLGNRFVILGSGDVGLIVARELALRGKKVLAVIEKERQCGGLERNRINCLEKFDIPLVTSSTVSEVYGTGRITGVAVNILDEGVTSHDPELFLDCDALITSVGLVPEQELIDSFGGVLPDWLFLCGNACFVHDVVDDVTVESERTGRFAALFAGGCGKAVMTEDKGVNRRVPLAMTGDDDDFGVLCVACPKGCHAVWINDSWQGLLCGREHVQTLDKKQE